MLLSSLLIFSDISSIFMFLADAQLLNKHKGLIKFVSSAYNSFRIRIGFMDIIHLNDK